MKLIRNSVGNLVAIVDSEDIVDIHNYSTDTNTTTLTIPAIINKDINFVNYGDVAWTLSPDLDEGLTINKSTSGITVNAGKSVSLRYDTLAKNFIIAGSSESTGGGGSSDAEDIFLSVDFEADPLGGAVAPSNSVELAISKLQGQSNILSDEKSDKAENRVYNAVITLDKDFYTNYTQTGNISLSTTGTPVVGVTAILNIVGDSINNIVLDPTWISRDGVSPDKNKTNTIYIWYTGDHYEYSITLKVLPDYTAPTVTSAYTSSDGSKVIVKFDRTIIGTPNFTINTKSITSQSIVTIDTVEIIVSVPYLSTDGASLLQGGSTITSTGGTVLTSLGAGYSITNNAGLIAADYFTRPNVTNIAGELTPIGSYTWTKTGSGTGTAGIVSNEFKFTSAVGTVDNLYSFTPGRNGTLKVVIGSTIAVSPQLTINFQTTTSGSVTLLYVGPDNSIKHIIAGVAQTAYWAGNGGSWVAGDVIEMSLNAANTFVLKKNGTTLQTVTISALHSGSRWGIYGYQDVTTSINSIEFFT